MSTTVPHPPHVSEEDKPLRRVVVLAYRAGRAAGKAEHDAFADAMAACNKERPGGERIAVSGRVAETIASAVRVDPKWFWENVPTD